MDELSIERDLLVLKDLPKRKSARADWHDYNGGKYFVTVCTHQMYCLFGRIDDREMFSYPLGYELTSAFEDMPRHFKDVDVIEYVVMPNHFHAIIHVAEGVPSDCETKNHHNNRSAVAIGSIKARVTRYARRNGISFQWQKGFHDRIIRNRSEYREIRNYIKGNITRWSDDRYHQDG